MSHIKTFGLVFFFTLLGLSPLRAQQLNDYRSASSGNWGTAATWQRFDGSNWVAAVSAPVSADGVITIRSSHTVTVAAAATADQIIVEAGGTLTLSSTLNLTDGTGTDLLVQGSMNWTSGTLGGPGSTEIANSGILTISSISSKTISSSLTNNGTLNWQQGNIIYNSSTPLVNNNLFNISGTDQISSGSSTFNMTNTGTITKTSLGTTLFNSGGSFINSGTLNFNNGKIQIGGFAITNSGNLNFAGGDFQFRNGSLTHTNGSVLSGTGNFINDGGNLILTIDLVIPSTILYSHEPGSTGNPIVSGAGNLTLNRDFTFLGTLTGAGTLTVNANTTWISGSLGRVFTNQANRTLTINGGTQPLFLGAGGALTNNGILNWQSGSILVNSATPLVNNNLLNISGNDQIRSNSATFNLTNTGTITKSSGGPTTLVSGGSFVNSGTITLNNGILESQNMVISNPGNMNFGGGSFELRGGSLSHNSGSVISGTGNFFNAGGNLSLNNDLVFPSTLVYTHSSGQTGNPTISGTGNLTINNDFTILGTITGTGTLTVNANTTWISGSMGRIFTNQADRTFTINGGTQPLLLGVGGALTNNGTLNWQNGSILVNSATPLVNNNLLNISGNDQIRSNSAIFNLTNTGTIAKSSVGTTTFTSGGNFANSGTVKGVGTFNLNIPVSNTGIIEPGLSPGIITLNTQQPFGASSTLVIEVAGNGGAGAVNGHDQVQRAGNLTLAGTLTVKETGTVPGGNYVILSLTSGTISGTFATSNLPVNYSVIYNSTSVVIRKEVVECTPNVSIAANPGSSICSGTPVTFTATPVNGGAAPIYQWKLNGNNVGTNSPTYSNASLANGDQVSVVMTSSAACASPTAATSNTVTMSVTSTVVPSVSIAASPGNTVCSGTSVTFTATPVNGGASPVYQWKLNGANVGTNSPTYTNSSLANGDQVSLVMTSSAACASPTAATSNTVTMVVTSTVVPSVSIAANPGNTVCSGTSVTFTATPVNGGASPVYQWKLNGANVGTNSPTYTNASLANGAQVSLVMTSSAACASPTAATSNTVTMTVTNTVVPTVSIAANPGNTVCAGTPVTFTATAVNGGASPVYQWKLNGNNVGTNSPTYSNASLANGDQVSVVMTSSAACTSPTAATSNTVTMTVTNTVVPTVSIAANPGNTVCAGTPVTFTATPVNGGASPVYQWKLNGANVGTNSPTYSNASLANGDQVSVVMTSSAACASPTTATSNIATMTVTNTVVPTVSIASNPGNTIFKGTSVTFTATPINGGASPVYQWKLNGNNVGINSPTYTNANLSSGDQVNVVMTSSASCASPVNASSNSVTMAVTNNVVLTGALTGNFATLGEAFAFINTNNGSGDVTATIKANTIETSVAVLNNTNYKITVIPEGDRIVTANRNSPIIALNGADNVTIDGLSFTENNRLTIRNTAGASAIQIFGAASNNLIRRCTLEASGINNSIIVISTDNSGNAENNTIEDNYLRPVSSNGVGRGIFIGTNSPSVTGRINNTLIKNNRLENIFVNNFGGFGIATVTNVNTVTITGNSIYNTLAFTNNDINTGEYVGILVRGISGNGSGITIEKNFVGGSQPEARGPKMVIKSSGRIGLIGISFADNNTSSSRISGNVVKNLDVDFSNPFQTVGSAFIGIEAKSGNLSEYSNNSIGDSLVNNSIAIIMRPIANGDIRTIAYSFSIPVTGVIANNYSGGFNVASIPTAGTSAFSELRMMSFQGTILAQTINGNTIGSSLPGSITINSLADENFIFRGIFTETNLLNPRISLEKNTIRNITINNRADLHGISHFNATSSASPSVSIINNKINNLEVGGSGGTISGIFYATLGGISNLNQTVQINGNQLSGFSTSSGSNIGLVGIRLQNLSTSVNRMKGSINDNTISSISNTATSGFSRGISITNDVTLGDSLIIERNRVEQISDLSSSNGITYATLNSGSNGKVILKDNTVRSISTTSNSNLSSVASGISVFGNNSKIERNKIFDLSNTSLSLNGKIIGILIRSRTDDASRGLVINNMISLNSPKATQATGIELSNGAVKTNVYHNSIFVDGSSTEKSYGLFKTSSAVADVKNNILYNFSAGSSLAFSLGLETSATGYSGNNNYLVSPKEASLGEIGGAAQTLAAWKSTTSQDGISLTAESGTNTNPQDLFNEIAVADLLIKTENIQEAIRVASKGTLIPSVTQDFHGEARSDNTPDIGADEFELVNICVPEVSISVNPGSEVCSGTPVTFTATPINSGASPVYQWKLNGANVGTNSPTYTNASLANGDQVSVVMTSSAACASPTAATSNTVAMVVTSTVVPSVSIAANPGNTVCAGTPVTFTATAVNGGASPVYQWKLNGANVGTNSPTYTNASLPNGAQVSLVMTSSAACASPTAATSNTVTMSVTNTVVPTVSIAANLGNTVCAETPVTFTATPVNGGASPVYQWKLNGANVGTNSPTYTNSSLPNGAQVSLVMTSSASCASPTAAISNTVTMTVGDNLAPEITAPDDIKVNLNPGETVASNVVLGNATATDNCQIVEVSNDAPGVFPLGQTIVKWTAKDASGNITTDIQLVTVNQANEPNCQLQLRSLEKVELILNSSGLAVLATSSVDQGSSSECGPISLSLGKTTFNCSDVGVQQVEFKVVDSKGNQATRMIEVRVRDTSAPTIQPLLRTFVWIMLQGQSYQVPDFRGLTLTSDNCGTVVSQFPARGTVLRSGGNYTIRLVATDPSGNSRETTINLRLLVLRISFPFFFREEEGTPSMIEVPWNTSQETVLSEYITLEGKDSGMSLSDLNWSVGSYNPIQPGVYFFEAKYKNEEWSNAAVQFPVLVMEKPKPLDISLSNQVISKNQSAGQVIGVLKTEDPSDNIHEYLMEPSADFKFDGNQVIWIGSGELRQEYSITVKSVDRMGQSISKEIRITREIGANQVTVYPNPASKETNIKVDLNQANDVTIKVFDSAGRLVYEKSGYHERGFVRTVDLQTLSAGLYQVQIQIGFETITRRLIKVN